MATLSVGNAPFGRSRVTSARSKSVFWKLGITENRTTRSTYGSTSVNVVRIADSHVVNASFDAGV